jgi:hypothetical protein
LGILACAGARAGCRVVRCGEARDATDTGRMPRATGDGHGRAAACYEQTIRRTLHTAEVGTLTPALSQREREAEGMTNDEIRNQKQ